MSETFTMDCFATLIFLVAVCVGNAQNIPDGKIIGGKAVDIAQYPYQLSYEVYGSHICGASIINKSWAVTAAHCCSYPVNWVSLRAGSSVRGSGGSVHKVSQMIVHSQYNATTTDYDIALLKVSTPFSVGPGVGIIALPSQGEPVMTGAMCDLSGWGYISTTNRTLPTHLQAVSVPVVSQSQCQSAYGTNQVTPRMICAGLREGGKDSCQGDSGGPMVSGRKLVGIASWGAGCGMANYPGVYTRVASLRDWIRQNAGV